MKEKVRLVKSKIKTNFRKTKRCLGLCEYKSCFHRSTNVIHFPMMNTERELCDEHTKIVANEIKVYEQNSRICRLKT